MDVVRRQAYGLWSGTAVGLQGAVVVSGSALDSMNGTVNSNICHQANQVLLSKTTPRTDEPPAIQWSRPFQRLLTGCAAGTNRASQL